MTSDSVFFMIRHKGASAIQALSALSDLNILDEYGDSLLTEAVGRKNTDAALWLIEHGIDVNVRTRSGKSTALHHACTWGFVDVARAILEHGGDVSLVDAHGNTPLWTAVFNANSDYTMVRLLMEFGAGRLANQKNKHGRSPLDLAAARGQTDLVQLLSSS